MFKVMQFHLAVKSTKQKLCYYTGRLESVIMSFYKKIEREHYYYMHEIMQIFFLHD